jgi:predicted alpha/beta superfamily hydrolase
LSFKNHSSFFFCFISEDALAGGLKRITKLTIFILVGFLSLRNTRKKRKKKEYHTMQIQQKRNNNKSITRFAEGELQEKYTERELTESLEG